MSLVICKIIDNKIYIESDSRITDINEAKNDSIYGVLKAIIVFPQLSISFAGSIYIAEKALKEIYGHTNVTLQYLVDTLLAFTSDGNRVEFIISTLRNNKPLLIKISNGKVEHGMPTAWVGDIDGFNDFQMNFHNMKNSGKTERESLTAAFSKVIDNPRVRTVGDFQVSTITEIGPKGDFFFRYFEKFTLFMGESQTVTLKLNPESSSKTEHSYTLHWGSAEGGSYGICYFVSVTPESHAVAYYFVHGNFGVLFFPRISFEGIVIKGISNMEFLEKINEQYKIPMRGFMLRDNTAMQLIDMRFPINA